MHRKLEEVKNLPDDKRKSEITKIKYDFRYVRFPCAYGFRDAKIEVEMDFSHATFFDVADFMNTDFIGYANFDSVKFHKIAYFIFAKFKANAYFFSAEFLGKQILDIHSFLMGNLLGRPFRKMLILNFQNLPEMLILLE